MTMINHLGRRLALPSTRQIVHELKMFAEYERARISCAQVVGAADNATWQQIRDQRLENEGLGNEEQTHKPVEAVACEVGACEVDD